jgi:hypothetical protein
MVRRLLAGTAAVALALACASPTLPLPPPVAPDLGLAPDADHVKLVAVCGGAEPGTIIVIINNSPNVPNDESVGGARTDGCGAWDAVVYAHAGDFLDITQQLGDQASQTLVWQVPTQP